MATMRAVPETQAYRVIHPLHDAPEKKCSTAGRGRIAMTRPVRTSLAVLRGYLILMTLMLGYHVLDMAGVLQHVH